jgi:hypothetical protein
MGTFSLLFGRSVIRFGLLCLSICTPPALVLAAPDKGADACEVFKHPEQFSGKRIQIRGVYVHYAEGTYVRPYPRCEGAESEVAKVHGGTAEMVRNWRRGGGANGRWMLSIMTGRFDQNANGGHLFFLESLEVLRTVDPY